MTQEAPATGAHPRVITPPTEAEGRDSFSRLWMAAVVACFVVAGHVWSVDTGLWLDDHSHFDHLRNGDWSFRSAVDAAELGIIGEVMDLWGRRETGLRFFRPIAFWIMRAEYTVGDWSPAVMHAFSMGWHFLCCMLVGALAMRCLGRRFWATVAASLMAIHPGHMATVQWIACQTEMMTTAFLLIGVLAYARHSGWPDRMFVRRYGEADQAEVLRTPPRTVTFAGIVTVICYMLALGCRENAVLFPLVCWLGDRLFGTARRRWVRWEHVAMGCGLVAYLVLRWVMLGGFPLPGKPYLMPIWDLGFPEFALHKISIYMIGLFAYVPVVPIGGRMYLADRPEWLYGGLVGTLLLLLAIRLLYRRSRGVTWAIVWLVCLFAPVIPVFASSHHLYLPGVAAALLMAAGLGALGGLRLPWGGRAPRPARWFCGLLIVVHVVALVTLTRAMGFAYSRGTLAEDLLVDDVVRRGRPIAEGDHLFFINIPVTAYYAVPAIKARLGLEELHGHVLTFSPDLLRMESPGEVEWQDRHRIRIRSGPDNRYLEGVTGQMLLGAMDLTGLTEKGRINAGLFAVTPHGIDDQGIRELVFEFNEPLDSPAYHFFYGSPRFAAYPLDVSRWLRERSSATTRTAADMP